MKYALMIYESAENFEARAGEDQATYWGAWQSYAEAIRSSGQYAGGSGLEAPETATTLRLRDGERIVQDGPYADTKEQLGGFFIVDVPDLDAALEWAARMPVGGGAVEVRPVMGGNCQATANGAAEMRAVLAK